MLSKRSLISMLALFILVGVSNAYAQSEKAMFVYATNADGERSNLKSKLITTEEFQKLYPSPSEMAADKAEPVGPFSIFHHLQTENGDVEVQGFYRVGDSTGKPLGYLKKDEVVQWNTRYVLEPQVNIDDGVFRVHNVKKQQGDEEVLEKFVDFAKPPAQRKLRLAFILEPPKEDLGDDTLYSVICLDRAADQSNGGISDIADKLEDLSMEIVFVYEATDALTWDIKGLDGGLNALLGNLMERIAVRFEEGDVSDMVRMGIVAFQDRTDHFDMKEPAPIPVSVVLPLSNNLGEFKKKANNLPAWPIGADWSEDGLSGIAMAMDMLDKDKYSSDHIVYFGFGSPHEHAQGGSHAKWGGRNQFSGNSMVASGYNTNNSELIGSTLPGLTVDSVIQRARPSSSSSPLTSKTIHTIMSVASYLDIQKALTKENMDDLKILSPQVRQMLNTANSDEQLEDMIAENKTLAAYGQNAFAMFFGAVKYEDFITTQQRGRERLKYLAQNESGNYPGFHGLAEATADSYKAAADELYDELNKIVPILQEAKKGDPNAIDELTGADMENAGAFTSGSFRTASQQMLSEILDQATFFGSAPVRDDDGYLVAHKNVLVGRGELKSFSTKLDGMITMFKDKADRSKRGGVKELLADLQKYAVETVTGEQLRVLPDEELRSIITELPLQTSALDMTVSSLAVMDAEDFERWVESIRLARKRCQDLLDDASKWAALTENAPQDEFAFIRVEDMP